MKQIKNIKIILVLFFILHQIVHTSIYTVETIILTNIVMC